MDERYEVIVKYYDTIITEIKYADDLDKVRELVTKDNIEAYHVFDQEEKVPVKI